MIDAQDLMDRLRDANQDVAERFPGDAGERQPVHTVYGGGHIFKRDTAPKLGSLALRALDTYAPDPSAFAQALGLGEELSGRLYDRVVAKLEREPVEDFRIDFEDGYGNRPDEEEDAHAAGAAAEVASGMEERTLSPFIGVRIKPFTEELKHRAVRTLTGFLSELTERTGRSLPDGFVITLPKVTHPVQVEVLTDLLDRLEAELGLAEGSVSFEIMIETPQSVLAADGRVSVPRLVEAGRGRCIAAHFGTYDYTASLDITAAHQVMGHPACDFARQIMKLSLAGRGIWLSDGATNVMPVPVHRGEDLSDAEKEENREAVHRAWRLHFDDIQHSLRNAFYQGWDLHPAQLPTRYAAVHAFFLGGLEAAGDRLRNFVEQAARATLAGDIFDDAATGQGLLNFFLRAVNSGAVTEKEATAKTGLNLDELRTRSFLRILEGRRSE